MQTVPWLMIAPRWNPSAQSFFPAGSGFRQSNGIFKYLTILNNSCDFTPYYPVFVLYRWLFEEMQFMRKEHEAVR
jgi:hypothetical protein